MIEPTNEMIRAAQRAVANRCNPIDCDECASEVAEAVLAIVERDQDTELTDLRALFELQWTRSIEADARWRAEDPMARANVRPDLGALLRWLMDQADQARAKAAEEIARAIEIADGRRCPECGGKAANGLSRPRRCGGGHTWEARSGWHDPAEIARRAGMP